MKTDLDILEQQLKYNFYKSIEDLQNKRVKRCKFKVGDKVSVRWYSDYYGYENKDCYIYYIGNRQDGYLGYYYYFKKILKNGELSNIGVNIPKRSKILNITKL